MSALDLVDLERYPLTDLTSAAARALVADARRQMAEIGAAELPGFIRPEGIQALVADAESLRERAHPSGGRGPAYLGPMDQDYPSDHPRGHLMPYAVKAVGYDVIPYSSPLRQIYELPEVTAFVEDVLDRGPLFHYADPCGALNLAVMSEGDELQWHFDQTDFVVSLAIQSALEGGDFDVVPRIRDAENENYAAVASVFAGDHSSVVTLPMTPGTLLIFEGRNSLHRVSPLRGERLRHVGLLAYDTKPDTVSSENLRATRYGRTTAFAEPPATWPVS